MLLSLRLFVALVGAATMWLVGWVAGELIHRRHKRYGLPRLRGMRLVIVRFLALVMSLALVVAATADGFNRHFSYVPTLAALFGDVSPDLVRVPVVIGPTAGTIKTKNGLWPLDHGIVEERQVAGKTSGIEARATYVYLPPAYFDPSQTSRRFPVLYLIHGSPGTSVDWLRGGYVDRAMDDLLRKGLISPFIIVMPDVNGGYRRDVECEDVVGGPQAQTYLVNDLTAWTDATYRTRADRTGRAIGGLSTGGYCGINIAFRHQDVFSAAVSHSGYGHPDKNPYTGELFGKNKALSDANTPDIYLPTIPIPLPMGVYLDAGAGDQGPRRGSNKLFDALSARGVNTAFQIVDGESHDFVAFRQNLVLSLPWLSKWFDGTPAPTGKHDVGQPNLDYLPAPPPQIDRSPGAASPSP